jgi:SulP family sulfate permease
VLCGFGLTRLGRAIRYVPYPVVGGFLGATGWLIVLGAVSVITGHRLQFATLPEFADLTILLELGAAAAMALVLYLTWHRSRSPIGLPVLLLGGVVLGHLGFWSAGLSLADAQAAGWVFRPPPNIALTLPWAEIGHYPWRIFADLSADLVAVIFVAASSTLFNTTGIEVATQRDANLERELNVTGLANMLSGAFGGYTGCVSVSRTVLAFNTGARGRLAGLTAAAIALLMLAEAPRLLGYIP